MPSQIVLHAFFVTEIIREKILLYYQQEVPVP